MVQGHQKTQWVHTTHLLITMANVQRGKDDKPIKFDDVYPYSVKKTREPDELDEVLAKAKLKKDMLKIIAAQ